MAFWKPWQGGVDRLYLEFVSQIPWGRPNFWFMLCMELIGTGKWRWLGVLYTNMWQSMIIRVISGMLGKGPSQNSYSPQCSSWWLNHHFPRDRGEKKNETTTTGVSIWSENEKVHPFQISSFLRQLSDCQALHLFQQDSQNIYLQYSTSCMYKIADIPASHLSLSKGYYLWFHCATLLDYMLLSSQSHS